MTDLNTPTSKTRTQHPPYLFFHRTSPTFRIRIPADLQSCLGKSEYRRSVGRCYAMEAKQRALKLAAAAFDGSLPKTGAVGILGAFPTGFPMMVNSTTL